MSDALPSFLPISNYVINANSTLSFTARALDGDQPFQTLTYSFNQAPATATLDSATGLFSWAPTSSDAGNKVIILRATDGANNTFKSFSVFVVAPPRFSQITNAPNGTLTLNISAFAGKTYRVEYKNNLEDVNWTPLGDDIVAGSNTISVPDSTLGNAQRFYRVLQLN
jgi:hypothetical protein